MHQAKYSCKFDLGSKRIQCFHDKHQTMFQIIVTLELYILWVFENPTLLHFTTSWALAVLDIQAQQATYEQFKRLKQPFIIIYDLVFILLFIYFFV